jgi:hypothetical protein
MREAMRQKLDSVVLERWHKEWSDGLVPTKDYAEFLAKYGLGVKGEQFSNEQATKLFDAIAAMLADRLGPEGWESFRAEALLRAGGGG